MNNRKSSLLFLYKLLDTLSSTVNIICKSLCLIIGTVLVINLFLGVFTRFVLNSPLSFTEEIARYCMLWFAFIGGSVAMRQKELISFTFIIDKMPPAVKKGMRILNIILVMVFLIVFLYVGIDAMRIFGFGKASVTKINLRWTAIGIYVGAAVMLLHCITDLFHEFCTGKEGEG